MKKGLFSLALLGIIVLASCKKSAPSNTGKKYQPLDFTEVNLGDKHNKFVAAAYDRYNSAIANNRLSDDEGQRQQMVKALLIEQVRSIPIDPSPIGLSAVQFQNAIIAVNEELAAHDFDVRNYSEAPCNPVVYSYLVQILGSIDNLSTLGQMYEAFDQIEATARIEVSGLDLDEVLGILQIARASAYLWSDANGSFAGATGARTNGGAKKVFIADVSSSATFFLRMGVMGAVFGSMPGTNAVIFAGWAVSAGMGSAMAALMPQLRPLPIKLADFPPVKKN